MTNPVEGRSFPEQKQTEMFLGRYCDTGYMKFPSMIQSGLWLDEPAMPVRSLTVTHTTGRLASRSTLFQTESLPTIPPTQGTFPGLSHNQYDKVTLSHLHLYYPSPKAPTRATAPWHGIPQSRRREM